MNNLWPEDPRETQPDTHVELRGTFEMNGAATKELRFLSSMPALLLLDGQPVLDGPIRFPHDSPEFVVKPLALAPGKHELRLRAHYEGITTRILMAMPAYLLCELEEVSIAWEGRRVDGNAREFRRINPQLGWIEWFSGPRSEGPWTPAKQRELPVTGMTRAPVAPPQLSRIGLRAVASGHLAEKFGYAKDDPAVRFFLRDLKCRDLPAGGEWRRYDLEQVRLGRPRFVLDLPPGAVVEFAGCESMEHERVQPWITLSDGPSCNLDHYVARGGIEEFMPTAPRGMRFLEVHVLAPEGSVRWREEEFWERHYYADPAASFECDDSSLNRIWWSGVNTFRACTEDSLIDNPTRERGQWTGDVVTVGLEIAAAVHHDLRPVRRALVQSSQCARSDGLVAGLCPGGGAYLSTYAIQWVSACMHFFELTGDRGLLRELTSAAERNVEVFASHWTPQGLQGDLGWAFVDWGYVKNEGPSDMALNLHFLLGLRDMVRWCQEVGRDSGTYTLLEKSASEMLRSWLGTAKDVGFHHRVLALRAGLLDKRSSAEAVEAIKRHYLDCFPNDRGAPRLSDPGASQPRLITPYFSHYALQELWKAGEEDFVIDQYRRCWGWALSGGRTTLLEVFDTRWSHCHQWSGCPTWQLSRNLLGLSPRFDLGMGVFDFHPRKTSIRRASGTVPFNGGLIHVQYARESDFARWSIATPAPITLRTPHGILHVKREFVFKLLPGDGITPEDI